MINLDLIAKDIQFAISEVPVTITYKSNPILVSLNDISNKDIIEFYGIEEDITFSFVAMRSDMPNPKNGEKIIYNNKSYRIVNFNNDNDQKSFTIYCEDLVKG